MASPFRPMDQGDPAPVGTEAPLYSYASRLQPGQIRLLQILPSKSGKGIDCSLVTRDIGTAEDCYDATSYVWGSPKRTHSIRVDSHVFPVTESAHNVLTALYDRAARNGNDLSILVWIDTICINQVDVQERSEQVQQMARELPLTLTAFLAAIDVYGEGSTTATQWWQTFSGEVLHVLFQPWFSRVWILQEACLARAAFVVSDQGSVPLFRVLDALWAFVIRVDFDQWSMRGSLEAVVVLRDLLMTNRPAEPLLFRQLIFNARSSSCSDARDHIYGLLGIAQHTGHRMAGLEVDYSKSTAEVFTDAAQILVDGIGCEEILITQP